MALVREILRSPLKDLTIVSYGGPDVGLLCATKKVEKVAFGFVSLDSIPLEPHFRGARQRGEIETFELDEGMFQWGLYAAANAAALPARRAPGSAPTSCSVNPAAASTVRSPYDDGEELVAMPAIELDVAFDPHEPRRREGQRPVPRARPLLRRPLLHGAAKRRFMTCEKLVETKDLLKEGSVHTLLHQPHHGRRRDRDAPNGAHFTECPPDYGRDEAFQKAYALTAKDPAAWESFAERYLSLESEEAYQEAVKAR